MSEQVAEPEGAEAGFRFPETGVIKVVSHHVSAGKQAWVLWKAAL